jgi:hypothetical protein
MHAIFAFVIVLEIEVIVWQVPSNPLKYKSYFFIVCLHAFKVIKNSYCVS